MPWATLIAGCLTGTALLAALAHFASRHMPLVQNQVRLTLLPAVAALAFVPYASSRPLTQITPVPAWLSSTCQILLAIPVVAATCWVQLSLMTATTQPATAGHPAALYPVIAQLTGWCALTVAAAACCQRSRYADLGGAVAAPFSLTAIALAWVTPPIRRFLVAPPATAHAATVVWYTTAAVAAAIAGLAVGDQWHRYTRVIHGRSIASPADHEKDQLLQQRHRGGNIGDDLG
jgi:hypothetical protein